MSNLNGSLRSNARVFESLSEKTFHKLIIGAALKDFAEIENFAYLFTLAGADVIDISAFPHSVLCAQKGINKALAVQANTSTLAPMIMVSVNVGKDPHFRRIKLDANTCTECELCISSCPSEAFYLNAEQKFSYNEDLCFGCSACLPECAFDALSFEAWDAFDSSSLQELISLGASAIEIHLNNDLQAFENFYRSFDFAQFDLQAFCIGSAQMDEEQLKQATRKIIAEFEQSNNLKPIIIQADGIPQSGARKLAGVQNRKDSFSMQAAEIILSELNNLKKELGNTMPEVHVQLAGGIDEKSFAIAKENKIDISGVAIGSYARKQIKNVPDNLQKQEEIARKILNASKEHLNSKG